MRVFIAIELRDDIKDELRIIQQKLSPFTQKGRYTDKNNFHLTVRFIGNIGPEEVNKLKKAIDYVTSSQRLFSLKIDKLGSFPKKNRHIVWAGLQGKMDTLHCLYTKMEASLSEQGFSKEEREYNPHITLGRNIQLDQSIEELNERIQIRPLEFTVNRLSLMESVNINGRLVYRPVYRGEFIID